MSTENKTEKHDNKSKEEPEVTGREKNEEKETISSSPEKETSFKKSKSWQKSIENFFIFWN